MRMTLHINDDALNRFIGGIDNVPALQQYIAASLELQTRERFEKKRDPDGKKWKPNRSDTPTLEKTGRLRESITTRITGDEIHIGTNAVYAAIHQFGGVIKPTNAKTLSFFPKGANRRIFTKKVTIPQRAFLGFGRDDELAINDAVRDFLDKQSANV